MVVDWYKDEQPRAKVKTAIESSLDADLPVSYDKDTFAAKTDLLLTHFIDMAVQGYGWAAKTRTSNYHIGISSPEFRAEFSVK